MTRRARRILAYWKGRRSFLQSVLAGMALGSEIYGPHPSYRVPQQSDVDAMRSDWERVGQDFATVIGREQRPDAGESETH